MQNYISRGDTVTLTAPYAVASGAGALVGRIFGVAADTLASGAVGQFVLEGLFDLAKDTSTFTDGALVYWDNSAKLCTSVTTGHDIIGCATMTNPDGTQAPGTLSGDATVRVGLSGLILLTGE